MTGEFIIINNENNWFRTLCLWRHVFTLIMVYLRSIILLLSIPESIAFLLKTITLKL